MRKELNFTLTVKVSPHSKPGSDTPLYVMECKTEDGRYFSQTSFKKHVPSRFCDLIDILSREDDTWQQIPSTCDQLQALKKAIDDFHNQYPPGKSYV